MIANDPLWQTICAEARDAVVHYLSVGTDIQTSLTLLPRAVISRRDRCHPPRFRDPSPHEYLTHV